MSEFLEKSDVEIADEAIKFAREKSIDGLMSPRALDVFWEGNGIKRFTAPPDPCLKVEKVESAVKQKLNSELPRPSYLQWSFS